MLGTCDDAGLVNTKPELKEPKEKLRIVRKNLIHHRLNTMFLNKSLSGNKRRSLVPLSFIVFISNEIKRCVRWDSDNRRHCTTVRTHAIIIEQAL